MERVAAVSLSVLGALAPVLSGQSWQSVQPGRGSLAYDPVRQDMRLLSGTDSWRWNGSWQRSPVDAAPNAGRLVYDAFRDRWLVMSLQGQAAVHLLGGGSNGPWVTVAPPGPPARQRAAIGCDAVRGVVFVFGGEQGGGALLGDAWEFGASTWTQVTTGPAPTPRHSTGITFDWGRTKLVLVGGFDGSWRGDTWEYDGTWTATQLPELPIGGSALAYDLVRARTVLTGGASGAYEYDGVQWTQTSTSIPGGLMTPPDMAYDISRGVVVRHGGERFGFANPEFTMEYDGASWSVGDSLPAYRDWPTVSYDRRRGELVLHGGRLPPPAIGVSYGWSWSGAWHAYTPPASPRAVAEMGVVYDTRRGRIVAYGGADANVFTPFYWDQTWAYDGTTWSQLANGPYPTVRQPMAYDARRDRVVMFSGEGVGIRPPTTSEFDGSAWNVVTTATVPPARSRAGMAYDVARNRVVMFGGLGIQFLPLGDTWEYDGVDWTQVTGSSPAPGAASMAYDPLRARCVLVKEPMVPAGLHETWEYDGAWTQIATDALPARQLDYDTARGVVVGTRGNLLDGMVLVDWAQPPTASFARYGVGCPGGAAAPTLDAAGGALPTLGTAFPMRMAGLPASPGLALVGFGVNPLSAPLPVPLDGVGLPDCLLWTTVDFSWIVAFGGTSTTVTLQLPPIPALAGTVVGVQALAWDATAPGGVGRMSNGALLRTY